MKRLISTLLVLVFLPVLASAQASDYSKGHGYAYFAPGASSPSSVAYAQVGAGGEGFFTRNLGAGVELGYLTPMRSWSDGVGTLSPNLVARFRAKDENHKLEPFVTGGYTLFFRSASSVPPRPVASISAAESTTGSKTTWDCGLSFGTTSGPKTRPFIS